MKQLLKLQGLKKKGMEFLKDKKNENSIEN